MDTDNKYYSLIIELVKKHKKFPGYEAILEDIVNDVYSHAEVIIKSIDNESVIQSYLEKVISTSIITVPKRMNYNNKTSHRVIPPVSSISTINTPERILPQQEETIEEKEEVSTDETQNNAVINIEQNEVASIDEAAFLFDAEQSKAYEKPIPDQRTNIEYVDKMINTMNADESIADDSEEEFLQKAESDSDIDDIVIEENSEENIDDDFLLEQDESEELAEVFQDENEINSELENESVVIEKDSELEQDNEIIESVEQEELTEIEDVDFDNMQIEEDVLEQPVLSEDLVESSDLMSEEQDFDIMTNTEEVSEENEIQESEDFGLDLDLEDGSNNEEIDDVINFDEQHEDESNKKLPEVYEEEQDFTSEETLELSEPDNDINITVDTEPEIETLDLVEPELLEDTDETIMADNDDEVVEDMGLQESMEEVESFELTEPVNALNESDEIFEENDSNVDLALDSYEEDNLIQNEEEIEDFGINENGFADELVEETSDFRLEEEPVQDELNYKDAEVSESKNDTFEFKYTDYSVFDFESKEPEETVDIEDVLTKIEQLDEINPELNIIKIFDLKYKKNMTMENIASELGIEKQDVINALNKMTDLV